MRNTKKCIIIAASVCGALVAMASAAAALCLWEDKTDMCYIMKKKAKRALKQMENKIEDKLDA